MTEALILLLLGYIIAGLMILSAMQTKSHYLEELEKVQYLKKILLQRTARGLFLRRSKK